MIAKRAFLVSFVALLVAVGVIGCVGYQVGPTSSIHAGARSIQFLPVSNKTDEPRLNDYLANALRKEVQRDGSYRLATQGDGNVVVSAELVDYDRTAVSFDPSDSITTRDSAVRILAHVVAKEKITGEVLLDEVVLSRMAIRIGTDLAAAERQAMPLLAENLARNIVDLLVDGAW